ncbi:MAG: ECF transporter S component [Candidatus Cryosericum sp.]|nr:ECF transporter S component [bacterium]
MEQKKLRVLALVGMLAAVGYVLQLFEFPLLPAAPFLKFDFGDVAVFMAGSILGPAAMVLTAVVKGILWALIGHGADGWVGACMNTVTVIAFALPVAFLSRSRRGWVKVCAVVLGTLAMTTVMVAMNLIVDPWYFKMPVAAVKAMMIPAIIPFNLLRGALNGTASVLVLLALQRTRMFRPV